MLLVLFTLMHSLAWQLFGMSSSTQYASVTKIKDSIRLTRKQ